MRVDYGTLAIFIVLLVVFTSLNLIRRRGGRGGG